MTPALDDDEVKGACVGWTVRMLWHRSSAQRALLLPVLAVAVVGATLLGTFLLLLTTSEHRALAVGLDRATTDERQLDAQYSLVNVANGPAVLSHGSAAVDKLLGSLPADRSEWLSSQMYQVDGTGDPRRPYVYLASYPAIADGTKLVSGAMPTTLTDDAGHIQTAVPQAVADAYGWQVGSVVSAADPSGNAPTTFVVTGTFELEGARSRWALDLLGGEVHEPAYPVIGAAGTLTTQAWGPLVVTKDAFTSGTASLVRADLIAVPRFDRATPAQVAQLRDGLVGARAALSDATSGDFAGAILRTHLPLTIDEAVAALQITRVGLVIVGLMLVALAVTVLLLAARLLAERRAAEQTLMASRGASGRQILALAALESLAVAVATTLVAPWLSALLFWGITGAGPFRRAGLHQDPGQPWALWAACATASLVLAAVLLGPVLRRRGSVVDAEQQLVRQDRRGGIARTGADLALVVLAGLALYQLRSYHSPVVQGVGGLSSLDPVLVAAPALVLLAGAVVALRLVPVVAHVGERLAARSRSLVGPLAAWEVGRRPGRAAGAVLLLTLVVGVGAFAQSFLATWRGSQIDQTDLAVGTDVRVVPTIDTPLQASTALAADPAVRRAMPVVDRDVTIGNQGFGNALVRTTLVGIDSSHADAVLRGRTDAGSWAAQTKALAPPNRLVGAALPGAPTHLVLDVKVSTTPVLSGQVVVTLVLQDADGARTPVVLPPLSAARSVHDLLVPLPAAAHGMRLVGLKTTVVPSQDDQGVLDAAYGDLTLDVSVGNVRVVSAGAVPAGSKAPVELGEVDPTHVGPLSLAGVPWTVTGVEVPGTSPSLVSLHPQDDAISVTDQIAPRYAANGGQGFTAVSTANTQKSAWAGLPVLVTPGLLSAVGGETGDELSVDLGGVPVTVTIVGTIAHLPGESGSDGILADAAALSRASLLAGSTGTLADQWWLQVADRDAAAVATRVAATDLGVATTRVEQNTEATLGPLHVGVQAALWIVTVAALGLGVAGLALSATVSVRTRRLELARLQALGASRRGLVRSVLVEYVVLGALGVVVGLVLGALLGHEIAPLITVSASGAPPVPGVLVHFVWGTQGRLLALLIALVGLTVATTTNALLRRASGELLRLGDER